MLNFLKKIFTKQEIPEEKIDLNELNNCLDQKTKPLFENLDNNINQVTNKISNEKDYHIRKEGTTRSHKIFWV